MALEHRQIDVFGSPGPQRVTPQVSMVRYGDRLSLLAFPDVGVSLEDVLGPPSS